MSFGGSRGPQLGVFISATLAVHNVPEGLAVSGWIEGVGTKAFPSIGQGSGIDDGNGVCLVQQVALVLIPKRISKLNTALWSIFTR